MVTNSEPKTKKVPVKVQRLMSAMSSGQRLVLTRRQSEVGDERSYCLEWSGRPVGDWTVKRALDDGLIVPSGDGLFPELDTQTYQLAAQ